MLLSIAFFKSQRLKIASEWCNDIANGALKIAKGVLILPLFNVTIRALVASKHGLANMKSSSSDIFLDICNGFLPMT